MPLNTSTAKISQPSSSSTSPFQIRGIPVKNKKDFKEFNCTSVLQLHNKGRTNNILNKPGFPGFSFFFKTTASFSQVIDIPFRGLDIKLNTVAATQQLLLLYILRDDVIIKATKYITTSSNKKYSWKFAFLARCFNVRGKTRI